MPPQLSEADFLSEAAAVDADSESDAEYIERMQALAAKAPERTERLRAKAQAVLVAATRPDVRVSARGSRSLVSRPRSGRAPRGRRVRASGTSRGSPARSTDDDPHEPHVRIVTPWVAVADEVASPCHDLEPRGIWWVWIETGGRYLFAGLFEGTEGEAVATALDAKGSEIGFAVPARSVIELSQRSTSPRDVEASGGAATGGRS
jgi:hypothetical protein